MVTDLQKSLPGIERQIFENLQYEIARLDVVNGKFAPTIDNLKALKRITLNIEELIYESPYPNQVRSYLGRFVDIRGEMNGYFATFKGFNPGNDVLRAIQDLSIETTGESLLKSGVSENVVAPISDFLTQTITSGGTYSDAMKGLSQIVIGDKENLGHLSKYVTQIATDATQQYQANYTKAVTDDLQLDWFLYSGSEKETSRCFCAEREEGYYHKKEVEHWGKTPSLWTNCTGEFKGGGRIPATNASSIFIYRGGYNCQHQLIPMSITGVPKNWITRAKNLGYIK